ncbi:MAG: peptidase S8 [Firmicutes bacterium]|nr:peptidase S8 [Bacillota bacterium]
MSAEIKYNLPLVGGIACNMNLREIEKLSNDPDVEYISFDSKVFALMDIAGKTISSKFPHEKGFTGKKVTVAVIDTGVTPHNDLIKPKNRIVGFKDFVNGKNKPYDDNGHGTHVAGIIAGNGYASNKKYSGIAPEANILAVKALDESGSGNTSDIVSAIEWVIETKDVYDTKILNLSLGSPATNPYSSDPLARAAEEAVRAGITVVAAAGNSGPSAKTILCPGNSPSVITVGAIDDNKTPEPNDDFIAPFSSRGPTKDGIKKPDVVAPGVDIMSLSNAGSNYVSLSGTSMATPVVSGSCCLLYQKAKKINPSQVKSMLKKSCNDLKESNSDQGSGVINLKNLFEEDINNFPINEQPKANGFFNENIIIFLLLILLFSGNI